VPSTKTPANAPVRVVEPQNLTRFETRNEQVRANRTGDEKERTPKDESRKARGTPFHK
jgi:hypothetical protein